MKVPQAPVYGSFGQKMLEKFGWSSGKGLGKNEDGMSASLTTVKKEDNFGVGCTNYSVDFQFHNIYNQSVSKFNIPTGDAKIDSSSKSSSSDSDSDSDTDSSTDAKQTNKLYGGFVQSKANLDQILHGANDKLPVTVSTNVDDDKIFLATEGSFYRKYVPKAKLERIRQQDMMLMGNKQNSEQPAGLESNKPLKEKKKKTDKKDKKEKKEKKEKASKKSKKEGKEEKRKSVKSKKDKKVRSEKEEGKDRKKKKEKRKEKIKEKRLSDEFLAG